MMRFKILGIAGTFCVLALAVGMVVGRIFSTGALPSGGAVTATVVQATSGLPAQTAVTSAPTGATTAAQPASPVAPAPTQPAIAATEAPAASPATVPAAPQATAQVEVSYIEYTIQKGDILYTLAEKYGVTVDDILALNDIANPESLTIGQVIRIPKK